MGGIIMKKQHDSQYQIDPQNKVAFDLIANRLYGKNYDKLTPGIQTAIVRKEHLNN